MAEELNAIGDGTIDSTETILIGTGLGFALGGIRGAALGMIGGFVVAEKGGLSENSN